MAVTLLTGGVALADDSGLFLSRAADSVLLAPRFASTEIASVPVSRLDLDLAGPFASELRDWGKDRFSVPLRFEERRVDARRSLFTNALAVEWQHNVNAGHSLTLSAQYGDYTYSDAPAGGGAGTSAAFSWSAPVSAESRVTGRLFVGDEELRDKSSGYAGRRYYGLLFEGRYALWREHAPFASLSWQRSDYDAVDAGLSGASLSRHDSSSRFAAGWDWQIQQNWGLRAEANYRLTDGLLDATDTDRTQLYLSTRYGFR